MKLEQQCVSLELAKKLKELGVKQESYFWWENTRLSSSNPDWRIHSYSGDGQGDFSAFTVAELGEMLPPDTTSYKHGDSYFCDAVVFYDNPAGFSGIADTEADARAKMLIYLLENKLI